MLLLARLCEKAHSFLDCQLLAVNFRGRAMQRCLTRFGILLVAYYCTPTPSPAPRRRSQPFNIEECRFLFIAPPLSTLDIHLSSKSYFSRSMRFFLPLSSHDRACQLGWYPEKKGCGAMDGEKRRERERERERKRKEENKRKERRKRERKKRNDTAR